MDLINPVLTNVFLALILCCLLLAGVYSVKTVKTLRTFVTSPAPDKPSPLAEFIQAASTIFSTQATMQLKTSLLGKTSAVTRAVSGMESDVAEDLIAAKSPTNALVLAALTAFSPKLKNRLMRSPLAAIALSQLNLTGMGKAGAPPTDGGAGGTSVTNFKL